MSEAPLIDPGAEARARAIDDLLPQTQCRQCGYNGCRPYAEAIVLGKADINQCPPGGAALIQELAQLLGCESRPLNESHGVEKPRELAVIDEAVCIGCKKCILVCPVDAILGAAKLMHTVIASECTGCNLCPPACPVDCIDMIPATTTSNVPQTQDAARAADRQRAALARQRYENRNARLAQQSAERAARLAEKRRRAATTTDKEDRRRVIAEVMQRVSAKERQADDGKH